MTHPFARLPQEGDSLGRYELTRKLGAGGMGAVFEGVDREAGFLRAIKILPRRSDPELLERFVREGQAMARMPRHPHVVQVMHGGETETCKYLVLDFAPGGDLARRVASERPDPAQAARWVRDLADGLSHAHGHGVLHRDLKPANVVFDGEGRAKLTDFGLAAVVDADSLTESGTLLGTPAYMAPEQALCEGVDPRTDVYGLGAVLFFALTGRAPYEGSSTILLLSKVAAGELTGPRELEPGVPVGLDAICRRAMARAPEDRYPDAAALRDALEAWLAAPAEPLERRPTGLVVGALATLGVVIGLAALQAAGPELDQDETPSASASPPEGDARVRPGAPPRSELERIRRGIAAGEVVRDYEALKRHVARRPDDLEAWVLLGDTALALGAGLRGRTAAGHVIALDPADPRGHALKARALLATDKVSQARAALARSPDPTHPWHRAVNWLLEVNAGRQTSDQGEVLVAELKHLGWLWVALATLYHNLDAYPPAQRCLEQGLRLQPYHVSGLILGTEMAIARGRIAEALEYLRRAKVLRGPIPDLIFLEGLVQVAGKSPERVLKTADRLQALVRDGGDPRHAYRRALVLYLRGASRYLRRDYEGSIRNFREAKALAPGLMLARRDLARSYLRLNRFREGLSEAKALVARGRTVGHLLTAWGLEISGRTAPARRALERYKKRGGLTTSDELYLRFRLGRRTGDVKAARAALQELQRRAASEEALLFARIKLCADEGDWAEARRLLAEWRRLGPDSQGKQAEAEGMIAARRRWPQ